MHLDSAGRNQSTRRAVAILMGGQTIAQIVPIAASTILTRLFSPHDYGLFAMFTAGASILAAMVHGRYQRAVVGPEDAAEAKALLALSLALTSVASAVLVIIFGVALMTTGSEGTAIWAAVPVLAFVTAASDCFIHYSLREHQDSKIAVTNIVRALTSAGLQVALGYAAFGLTGLVVGAIAGGALSLVPYRALSRDLLTTERVSPKNLRAMAVKHHRFPIFDLPANLLVIVTYSGLSLAMPVLYSPSAAGFLAIALRVLGMPADFLGVAISQVYLRQIASSRRDTRLLMRLHWKTAATLVAIATPPCLVILLFGPSMFAWVFGDAWRDAGNYAAALAPMIWARMIATPFTAAFQVTGRQKALLQVQSALFLTTLGTVGVAHQLGATAVDALSMMAAANVVVYILLFALATRIVRSIQRTRSLETHSS